jgi:hypothetical protein
MTSFHRCIEVFTSDVAFYVPTEFNVCHINNINGITRKG